MKQECLPLGGGIEDRVITLENTLKDAITTKSFQVTCTTNTSNSGSLSISLSGYTPVSAVILHPYVSAATHILSMNNTTLNWGIYGIEGNLLNHPYATVKVIYVKNECLKT